MKETPPALRFARATTSAFSSFWAKTGNRDRDRKQAEVLIVAALDLVREPSGRAELRAGRAALKEAFGQGFRVKRDDVLKILLASAIFFSSEA